VTVEDAPRFKILLKQKRNLLKVGHIVLEDLKHRSGLKPLFFKAVCSIRKLFIVLILMRRELGINWIGPLLQVWSLLVSALVMLVYLIKIMPFDNEKLNLIEILNNMMLYFLSL